jgi:hypothetical protein
MNIRGAVLEEHSKRQSDIITAYIGNRQKRFDELMELVYTNEEPIARRAAWTMGHCCREHPELIHPHLETLYQVISSSDTHPTITRNTLLIVQMVKLSPELAGKFYNLCYEQVNERGQMAATRVYAMSILANICETESALLEEVELLINQHFRSGSAGFKSQARHIRRKLERIR